MNVLRSGPGGIQTIFLNRCGLRTACLHPIAAISSGHIGVMNARTGDNQHGILTTTYICPIAVLTAWLMGRKTDALDPTFKNAPHETFASKPE